MKKFTKKITQNILMESFRKFRSIQILNKKSSIFFDVNLLMKILKKNNNYILDMELGSDLCLL